MREHRFPGAATPKNDNEILTLNPANRSVVPIDLNFDVQTVDGDVFHANRLMGRPTILVLLRYLG